MMNSGLKMTSASDPSNSSSTPVLIPEIHKVLLKPTADCWQYALAFFAGLAEGVGGAKFAKIMEDQEKLLEFERQLIVHKT